MRILPVPDEVTAPFWAAAAEHRLVIQQCQCGRLSHPPVAICPECRRHTFTWLPMSGYGTVYAFTTVCHAVHPVTVGRTPYVIALIALDEGPRMLSNLRRCDAEEVRVGLPVQVIFEELSDTVWLPQFTPRRDGGEEAT